MKHLETEGVYSVKSALLNPKGRIDGEREREREREERERKTVFYVVLHETFHILMANNKNAVVSPSRTVCYRSKYLM